MSLRDDYVFALDRWRRELPSVGDNRYELLPLTGEKAYLAVAEPGKLRDPEHPIVTAECAIEIVRFVAGDKEQRKLDELVVVPPLLSLICEQLNAYRIKHGREQIEPTFQKDTANEILEDYYQSRFRDRPVELRMLVEEHLLSAEGYRQPVNVDTAERMLEKVCPNNDGRRLLDDLVAGRLLTIVEHGSLRRFELTHDILCPIARRSRDARRELEEKNRLAKEAELAQQRQHEAEASAREAANRAAALDAALKKETQARTDADLARATAQAAKERAVASKKAADELIRYMQYDLSKRLGKLGRLGILDAVTARIIKYHEEHPPEPGDEAARDAADRERSVALIQQGDILRDQGHLPEALKAYRDSLEIAERLTKKDPDNTLWQRDLFLSYINVGDVQFAKGDLSSALKSFRDGLAISEKLAKQDPRNADRQRDLSLSYEKVGDVQRSQGDLSGALKSYRESLGMREKLAKQDSSNSDWQRDLSVSYKKVGDVQSAQDDFSGALQSFRHGLGIAEKLAKQDPGNAIWQRDLSLSYEKVGFMQGVQGDFSGALKSYRDGVGILEELAKQDPGHAGWQHGLSAIYNNVGSVQNAQGDHSGALKSYRESLGISEKLVKQDPGNAIWQGDLAWVYWQTGSAWAQAEPNSKNEARAMMEKGRDILRQLKEGRRLTANMQKWLDSIEVDLWKMQENK